MQTNSDLVIDTNAMLLALKHQLVLLEKQIRMVSELAEGAPVLQRQEGLGGRQEQADFVVVHKQRMAEILEQMKHQVKMIKVAIETVSEGAA